MQPLVRYRLFHLKNSRSSIIHHSFGFSDIFLEGVSRPQRPPACMSSFKKGNVVTMMTVIYRVNVLPYSVSHLLWNT